jgi:hypothetical protein
METHFFWIQMFSSEGIGFQLEWLPLDRSWGFKLWNIRLILRRVLVTVCKRPLSHRKCSKLTDPLNVLERL